MENANSLFKMLLPHESASVHRRYRFLQRHKEKSDHHSRGRENNQGMCWFMECFWEVHLCFVSVCRSTLWTGSSLGFVLQVSHTGFLHCCWASSPAGRKYKYAHIVTPTLSVHYTVHGYLPWNEKWSQCRTVLNLYSSKFLAIVFSTTWCSFF